MLAAGIGRNAAPSQINLRTLPWRRAGLCSQADKEAGNGREACVPEASRRRSSGLDRAPELGALHPRRACRLGRADRTANQGGRRHGLRRVPVRARHPPAARTGHSRSCRTQPPAARGDRVGDRARSGRNPERAILPAPVGTPVPGGKLPAPRQFARLFGGAGHVPRPVRSFTDAGRPGVCRFHGRLRQGGAARRRP